MTLLIEQQFLTEEELDELNTLILDYANEDDSSLSSLSELDGFLTAILSSPRLIQPSEWIPRLWNYQEPQWENQSAIDRYFNLVFHYYNELISRLNAGKGYYFAQFEIGTIDDKDYLITGGWLQGYIFGLELAELVNVPRDIQIELELIKYYYHKENFLSDDEIENYQCPTVEEVQEKAQKIENAVLTIYQYVKDNLYTFELPRQKKIGVNSPCPCGSGKKYKKCCLH